MKIDTIYINTYRKDFRLAKICVASIRHWYPDIEIKLIKDLGAGEFRTKDLEDVYGVEVMDTGGKKYGWGFGKFEPLFLNGGGAFLFMDADTVMTGPVLDVIRELDADFVVDREVQEPAKAKMLYYDAEKLKTLDEGFTPPGYYFNTGQWAGTAGIFRRDDFDRFIEWEPRPSLRFPDIFSQADQGLFNYLVQGLEQKGTVKVARIPLMIWPSEGAANHIDLDAIRRKDTSQPYIIHWAGMKRFSLGGLPRADILNYFRDQYYARAGWQKRAKDTLSLYLDLALDKFRGFRSTFAKMW